jgi:hypothetical protein
MKYLKRCKVCGEFNRFAECLACNKRAIYQDQKIIESRQRSINFYKSLQKRIRTKQKQKQDEINGKEKVTN